MILSLDLGATNVKAALIARQRNSIKKLGETVVVPTRADCGREGIVNALDSAVKTLLSPEVKFIAVSSAGDVDAERALITYATQNLPGMTGFDYNQFGKKYSLPVYALNDAYAALLGEMYCGAGIPLKHERVAMLTFGSGVGGAYFADGGLVANQSNGFARFGHITLHEGGAPCTCGKSGCAECYLSGRAIHRFAKEAGIDGADIFERYRSGSSAHVKLINSFRCDLISLLEKVNSLSPFKACILGGGVIDWIGDNFACVTRDTGFTLLRAELGNDAGAYGAAIHALKMRGELW